MAYSVEIVSNKAAVMAELNKATGKALHTIGLTFVRLAGHEADRLICRVV
ncbi:MAG: hypothetical protein LBE35_10175 [Clostridiales bacterium]|nr:hypothetical protein [Clostridiales bacterium]